MKARMQRKSLLFSCVGLLGLPEHEAGHDLLGIVVVLGVGKRDAGAVDSDPAAPLDTQHQRAH
jgi:hypothetical protein